MACDQSGTQLQQLEEGEGATPVPEESIPRPGAVALHPRRGFLYRLVWGAGGLVLGALATAISIWYGIRPEPPPQLVRFLMDLPAAAPLSLKAHPLAFSADGTHLAYIAQADNGTQLYVRALNQIEAKPVPGTASAYNPFYAPDGSWIGYFDSGDLKLKKVPLAGGEPVVLCDAQFGLGAWWGTDGYIIFTPGMFSGLWRIPAAGGRPEPVTQLQEKEFTHRWPETLPDGKTVIFTIGIAGAANTMHVAALSLKTGKRKMLLEDASDARYSPTGHLLFLRGRNLMGVRIDPARLEVLGTPFLIKQGIETDRAFGAGHFAFSRSGSLAYASGGEEEDLRTLAWADRQGGIERLTVSRGTFSYPRLSPDGRQLAVAIHSLEEKSNIWTLDVASGAFTRLTFEGNNSLPVWTPDSKHVTFASDREGQWNIFWAPADGSGPPELLRKSENPEMPNSWSPDGVLLAFTDFAPETGPDIWILSTAGEQGAYPFLRTQNAEWGGAFSPDGRWLAYSADDAGPDQVYVRPFPGPGEKYQISTAEGREPVWGHDGRELFFRYWKGLMSVGVQAESEFNPDPPRLVLSGDYETGEIPVFPNYDVSADGQRFVMIPRERKEKKQINIDLNCFEELKRSDAETHSNRSR